MLKLKSKINWTHQRKCNNNLKIQRYLKLMGNKLLRMSAVITKTIKTLNTKKNSVMMKTTSLELELFELIVLQIPELVITNIYPISMICRMRTII